ncbi:hypothetical protein [Fluviicola chungangensis]|uniref:Uncharacterized protein n=1 Tax=Fluviicola chungangensis TaxID=2597671 RepID=A0A556MJR6_9FLAO|nr:hypothetical protein [Fluviicola chungangensis]TSJ40126.1 hypothetical protein FO442_16130 [Fluviicola chungangensis]
MFRGHFISIVYVITALIFGILAFLERSETLDVALKEVYFAIPKSFAWLALAFCFLLFAGISLAFELSKKPMNLYFFGAHYLLTIISLAVIYFAVPQEVSPTKYTDYSLSNEAQQVEMAINTVDWVSNTIYILIGAQIIFGLNILFSILKSRKVRKAQG